MGQSAVPFRSNWQNNNPKLWVLVSKAKHHILHVCQMSSPYWTGSVHFDPELKGDSFGFGLYLALNFFYFQKPQYSVRKLGNFWIMRRHLGMQWFLMTLWMVGSQSHQWLESSQAGVMSLRHELAVMAQPFAAESCWCVAKQAHWKQCLLGELHGKWLFWQNGTLSKQDYL